MKYPERHELAKKKWRETHREAAQNYARKHDFGITTLEYKILYRKQNGCCAICRRHQRLFKKSLAVDHNHLTKEIRGLLCISCNTKLPIVENVELRQNAIQYLGGIKCHEHSQARQRARQSLISEEK